MSYPDRTRNYLCSSVMSCFGAYDATSLDAEETVSHLWAFQHMFPRERFEDMSLKYFRYDQAVWSENMRYGATGDESSRSSTMTGNDFQQRRTSECIWYFLLAKAFVTAMRTSFVCITELLFQSPVELWSLCRTVSSDDNDASSLKTHKL